MDRIIAAVMFFTKLPLWRWFNPPAEAFRHTVEYWSLTGLLTGSVMAATLWVCSLVMPVTAAVVIAVSARLLLTGALHEDGLADFFDGFGASSERDRILEIMKDSRIGSYGVIALIIYFLLLTSLLGSMPVSIVCAGIIAGDVWSKSCSSMLINLLPYCRTAAQAKNKLVYNPMSVGHIVFSITVGLLSLLLLPYVFMLAAAGPVIVVAIMTRFLRSRIGGYTGDCCGATFLLSELSFYLILAIISFYQ